MQQSQEHQAVRLARNNGDTGVLSLCLGIIALLVGGIITFSFIGAIVAESQGDKENGIISFLLSGILYVVIFSFLFVIILVTIRIMRQTFLGNMLQVEYSDYAWLRDWCNHVAADLKLPKVEIFVTQDPYINAFALGFMSPYSIVLHSGSLHYLTHDELKAVVVHEMGHVKYSHTKISAYTGVLANLPIIGGLCSYILDFWSRRAELTADRLAVYYLNDPSLVKRSLIKVHVGPDVAKGFNDVTQQWQVHNTRGLLQAFAQTLSNHPFLVKRLTHIDQYAQNMNTASLAHSATTPKQV